MMPSGSKIELTIGAHLSALDDLADFMTRGRESFGIPEKCFRALELAADEAVSNVIQHACSPDDDLPIHLRLSAEPGWVTLEIEDQGGPFCCDGAGPDLCSPLMERRVGGLGLHIIDHMMDRVERQRDCGVNRLVLRKKM